MSPAAPAASEAIEVRVPDIGDFKDVPVIEVLVKAGDRVRKNDSLITLESDKATMDVPSPAAGRISELAVQIGDRVSQGSLILRLSTSVSKPAQATVTLPPPGPEIGRAHV